MKVIFFLIHVLLHLHGLLPSCVSFHHTKKFRVPGYKYKSYFLKSQHSYGGTAVTNTNDYRHKSSLVKRCMVVNNNTDRADSSVTLNCNDNRNKVKEKNTSTSQLESELPLSFQKMLMNIFQKFLLDLANLSLLDYQWRSNIFKTNEADRKMEESLARMMGEDDPPAYIRPMNAGDDRLGPLGQAEKALVSWLSSVIEEEGTRAKLIAQTNGTLIRPKDLNTTSPGPLSSLERTAISFLAAIRTAEMRRREIAIASTTGSTINKDGETNSNNSNSNSNSSNNSNSNDKNARSTAASKLNLLLRPMDLDINERGPLGDAEARAVNSLRDLTQSETLRGEMTRRRNETVRPMDVPGVLGEWERRVMDIVTAEKKRAKEQWESVGEKDVHEKNKGGPVKKLVRPKDAKWQNPLGILERDAEAVVERLRAEEKERLRQIKRFMNKNRPMEVSQTSFLGLFEAFVVGIVRAPLMLYGVFVRVKELMQSEILVVDKFANTTTTTATAVVVESKNQQLKNITNEKNTIDMEWKNSNTYIDNDEDEWGQWR